MSILKNDCFILGYISKPHGHKGELQLVLQIDLPDDFSAPKFAFVEINEKLVPFFISKFEFIIQGKVIIAFDDIYSLDQAEHLSSHQIFLHKEFLPKSQDDDQFYEFELIGYTVIDDKLGAVGTIESIEQNTHQPMLIVKNKNGEEILIPFVQEFIKSFSKKHKQIEMILPEGLI